MLLEQIRAFARSTRLLRLGSALSLSLSLSACGPLPEASPAAEEPAASAEPEVAQQQQPLIAGDCLRAFQACNAACARLEQSGGDATLCYSDCSAQLYNCQCRKNPRACFQG